MSLDKRDRQISARVPSVLWEFVEREAYLEGVSKSAILVRALEAFRRDVADPDAVREKMDELRTELKNQEMRLPEYYARLVERQEEAADRDASSALEDPVQDAIDGIAEDFEKATRRPFDLSMNRFWLSERVRGEPALKGSVEKHVKALVERLGLDKGGARRT